MIDDVTPVKAGFLFQMFVWGRVLFKVVSALAFEARFIRAVENKPVGFTLENIIFKKERSSFTKSH